MSRPTSTVTAVGGFAVKNDRLFIGGCDAVELAHKYGTPSYVLDLRRVTDTAKAYTDILKKEYPDFDVCYASKAFCCTGIYAALAPLGLCADVVSGGELFTAIKGGIDPRKIYFHGNNKTESEIVYALEADVGCFVVDSELEARLINKHAAKPQNVLVRVNPGVEAHTHRFIQTTAPDSKFGFSIADGSAKEFITSLDALENLRFAGIACHIGSQIFEKQSFEIAIEKMTDFIVELDSCGISVERLDLGGGFGIRYIAEDLPLSPEEYMLNSVAYLKSAIARKKIAPPKLVVEPGRSIVGEAGITLYTVGAIKTVKGIKTYAAVDGGMFENPRTALYDAQYSAVVANKASAPATDVYTIAGKCCESGDILIRDISLPKLESGDILAVLSTGAYHYSMASNYNRNPVPPVIAVRDGRSDYMVRPQTYDDITRNDVIPFSEET